MNPHEWPVASFDDDHLYPILPTARDDGNR